MNTGDAVTLTIDDLAFGGDGIGRAPDGRAVFVPFSAVGDELEVELVEVHSRYARGRIGQIRLPSETRGLPGCPHYGQCGGCCYQHLTYEAQAEAKPKQLADLLRRMAHAADAPEVTTIALAPEPYNYRNKLDLSPVIQEEDKARTIDYGYTETDGRTLFPLDNCPLAQPALNGLLAEAKKSSAADHNARAKHPRRLVLRKPADGPASFYFQGSGQATERLGERLLGQTVVVPPLSFWQINPPVADRIVETVVGLYEAAPTSFVIDAYAGVGPFSLALGKRPKHVLLIERDQRTMRAARHNHRKWGLAARDFVAASAEEVLGQALRTLDAGIPDTTVILDPPRTGCNAEIIQALVEHKPGRIIYASCDAATLARDVRRLREDAGYALTYAAWAHMFPPTAHFERVVGLAREASRPEPAAPRLHPAAP